MDAKVIIVGAGVSGLAMAITLRRSGCDDFLVLEKTSDLGGTWRDNRYPGCASDVPAHMYTFSFSMKFDWRQRYGAQASILNYLRAAAEQFDITQRIRFNAAVVSATFDSHMAGWIVKTKDGTEYQASAIVLAVGLLHRPAIPNLPGLDAFSGTTFHSAEWNHYCDLTGKRVAIIGTGASAVQIIPEIAGRTGRLHVFQRTPAWILPRRDKNYSRIVLAVFRKAGPILRLYRWYLYWRAEIRVMAFRHQRWLMRIAELRARRQLRRRVPEPAFRSMLAPRHAMGCKQLILSSQYYRALGQENVELVTTPLARVQGDAVVTADGTKRSVDVIILATGFRPISSLDLIQIRGNGGRTLKEAWRSGPEAFLGVCVTGFPNLFLMVGPNSGVAHTSIVFLVEDQARYIARLVSRIGRCVRSIDVRAAVQCKFNRDLQRRLRRAVWSVGGCRSWHLDTSGINRVLWPDSTVSYWVRTRRASFRHFITR